MGTTIIALFVPSSVSGHGFEKLSFVDTPPYPPYLHCISYVSPVCIVVVLPLDK